jgi:hypothetical protein
MVVAEDKSFSNLIGAILQRVQLEKLAIHERMMALMVASFGPLERYTDDRPLWLSFQSE